MQFYSVVIVAVLLGPQTPFGQHKPVRQNKATPSPSKHQAPASPSASVRGTLVGAESEAVIAAASVVIRKNSKVVARSTTDGEGRYSIELAPGFYEITFKIGKSSLVRFFEAREGKVAKVNGRMSQKEGEVIIIKDKRRTRRATAKNFNARRTPPYSDEAIAGNHWRRAWLVLDVTRSGRVSRVKFINRPGKGLDEIAVAEAFKLEFNPSLDEDGNPRTSLVIWSFEWPAYWWLVDRMGSSSAVATENNPFWGTAGPAAPVGAPPLRSRGGANNKEFTEGGADASATPIGGFGTGVRVLSGHTPPPSKLRSMVASVPCRGTAPIESGSISAVQRDCSRPELGKLFDSEPWIYPKNASSEPPAR